MTESFKRIKLSKRNLKVVTDAPGVYIFWDKDGNPLYVGKSVNLRSRLSSYLTLQLSEKTRNMMSEATYFSTIRVTSELEALLLEARLVKAYQTKYNSQLRDDKHPLYIRITREVYPRVLTARKIESNEPNLAFFGPFPASTSVAHVLLMLRKIFPYSQHKLGKRGCLYSQMGLCDPCPNEIEKANSNDLKSVLKGKYLGNIRRIRAILSGNIKRVLEKLDDEMKKLAKHEQFEEAANVRNQVERLMYITTPITPTSAYLENPDLIEDIKRKELDSLKYILKKYLKIEKLSRIECFDVAHLAGSHTTSSMVTFIDGEAEKRFYRHFKIRQKKPGNDIAALSEVAKRRSRHFEDWGIPDLVIVDGGRAQVGALDAVLKEYKIPVVGLAKRFETLVIPFKINGRMTFKELRVPRGPSLNLLQRIRDEAHRFARRLHHKLILKELIN